MSYGNPDYHIPRSKIPMLTAQIGEVTNNNSLHEIFWMILMHLFPSAYQNRGSRPRFNSHCHRHKASLISHWSCFHSCDLGVAILQAIGSNRVVSPLDYDTFANKIHELDVVSADFIENIIEKYTHTQSAVEVVDSSAHALVRGFLDFRKQDNVLNLARRRASTGVFLDAVAANMLADRFTDLEDWSSVIHVMWELCLQNYFNADSVSALPLAFSLLAGVKLVHELPPEPVLTNTDDSNEFEKLLKVTESVCARDDTEPIERGQPVHPTKSEVASAVAEIRNLTEISKQLPKDFLTESICLANKITSNKACLDHEIAAVSQLYDRFAHEREARWSARQEVNREHTILRNARQTLREIVDEEERLNYFRDLETISLKAWLAPRTRKERHWSRMKEWRQDIARQHAKQQEEREPKIS
ncbi:hypothetical protein D915_009555 [Fasciola hepatica]|uniref:Uncharacterized protein n=1 Tax=Fasciola hepatica TaxID=6192 RepID=A0A4E0QXT6_FASHE|nr:hypothetical protein D915_009555 [Fasciola hepatica]